MKEKQKSFTFVNVYTTKLVKSICMLMHVRVCVQQLWQRAPLHCEWLFSKRRMATGGKARHLRSLSLFLSLCLPLAPPLCLVSLLLAEEPQAAVGSVWVPSTFNEQREEGRFLSVAANRVRLSVCPTDWLTVRLSSSASPPDL